MTLSYLDYGYNELPYNEYPEGTTVRAGSMGWQCQFVISPEPATGMQAESVVANGHAIGMQTEFNINDFVSARGWQALFSITDALKPTAWQDLNVITNPLAKAWQAEFFINDKLYTNAFEAKQNPLIHSVADVYNLGGYNEDPYNAPAFNVNTAWQYEGRVSDTIPYGWQAQFVIDKATAFGWQDKGVISITPARGWQADSITVANVGWQCRIQIYNTDNLRVLYDFPSRGSDGLSWTASSTMAGDFNVNNLNTDFVEQVWRSASGVKSVNLTSDTDLPQGVFLDTLAILNHNLTTSAVVTLIGSDNPGFSPVGITIPLTMERLNSYYIAPELPLNGYRYWRLNIDDPTNPNDYLEIGVIVFGEAIIFQGECFVDEVRYGRTNFKDSVKTEGNTNVMNNRGTKKRVGLSFQKIKFGGGNYRNLQTIYDEALTILKALWIPTPQYPSRFATFAKLVEIPEETHNDKGEDSNYVDFDINLDEAE